MPLRLRTLSVSILSICLIHLCLLRGSSRPGNQGAKIQIPGAGKPPTSSHIFSHMPRTSSTPYLPYENSVQDASAISFTSIQVFNYILLLLPWLSCFLWHIASLANCSKPLRTGCFRLCIVLLLSQQTGQWEIRWCHHTQVTRAARALISAEGTLVYCLGRGRIQFTCQSKGTRAQQMFQVCKRDKSSPKFCLKEVYSCIKTVFSIVARQYLSVSSF